ncbi:MAG: ATP-binding protein [Armatimonadetes bacterium]|nr:ATP-binding protein [Armatimonadota bacterium]
MKIKIENFGPIDKFEVDFSKDIIAIFGKNNVGKSYALSLIYILEKNLLSFHKELSPNKVVIAKSNKKKLLDIIEERTATYFHVFFLNDFHNSINKTFGNNIINQFSKKNILISISHKKINIKIKIDKNLFSKISINYNYSFELKKSIRREKYYEKNNKITLYLIENSDLEFIIHDFILDKIDNLINEIATPFFLPASRSGLYLSMSSFNQIFAELSQKREGIESKIEIPAYTEPVADFYLNLTKIYFQKKLEKDEIQSLVKKIENKILNGSVEFDQEQKKLFFIDDKVDLRLDLSQTSSMVSEIVPFVALLKYVLPDKSGKKIVFIEEPEAHLHPEVQVKLTEILTEFTKYGIKIIFISHSNYIFNKLNNLILSKVIECNKIDALLINMDKNGSKSTKLEIDELGIEDQNFTDTSEELYDERMKIIDNLNEDNK